MERSRERVEMCPFPQSCHAAFAILFLSNDALVSPKDERPEAEPTYPWYGKELDPNLWRDNSDCYRGDDY